MARLAIGREFLAEYAKLDKNVRSAVDTAIAEFARQTHARPFLETPRDSRDSRIRTIGINGVWRGVVLAPDSGDTYCLLTVLPHEKVNDFAASHRFGAARASRALEVRDAEELRLILAHPFAAWRAFLHPSQHEIAYRVSYSGSAQVTGGPGTGKTVTVLHRAAFLAERAGQPRLPGPVLLTTFNGNLAESLHAQLDLLIPDAAVRDRIEVLNVDRLAYRVVKQARGTPVLAYERELRVRWAQAAADAGLDLTPAFGKNEWEQVILAQDLRAERAYLTCPRTGRGRPLTKAQRSQVWQAAERVTAELAAAGQSTHFQLANEATQLLRQPGAPRYRHILVDEAQDLHPAQWRLLRAAVDPGPDDLFIAADPHQRIYGNRVALASLRISVRGRSRRLSLNYRTTQEILAWALPLLGADPVTGLDGEADSLLGYRSPMHGPRPQAWQAASRAAEFGLLTERVGSWLSAGLEPHAIGVTARSAALIREAREALEAAGIATASLSGRSHVPAVRTGTMHAMKGLEFQAVAVIGVEQGLVPEPRAVTPETEDPLAYAQDLQRERCVLFVACTRARDHLHVSGTGEPSPFLPPGAVEPVPPLPLTRAADPFGLLADDGEHSGIARYCCHGGEHLVQCLGHHGRCRASPDAPASRFVDQVGCGHLPHVGLSADALAQVRVCPHGLAHAVGQFEGDGREHVVKRGEPDGRGAWLVQQGEVLGVRVRVADGHVERRAAQQAGHVAGIAEVPDDAGEIAQGRAAFFLVLQPGRQGGGLAAVFLVHPDRNVPGWCALPVIALDRQDGDAGDVEQLCLGHRQPAGGGEPQAGGLVGGHCVRAVRFEDPGRGGVPGRELPGAVASPAQQRLALEAGQRRAEPALRRGGQGEDVEGTDHPLQVTGRHGGVSAVGGPAGPVPVGEHHDRPRAVAAEGRQDAVGVHRANPGQECHPLQGGSLGQHVLEEIQATQVPRAGRGAYRQPDRQGGTAEPPPLDPLRAPLQPDPEFGTVDQRRDRRVMEPRHEPVSHEAASGGR